MQPRFSAYSNYSDDTIVCFKCRNSGVITWDHSGSKKDFVGIKGDFYERLGSKAPYPIEIVCNTCGTVMPAEQTPQS